MVWNLFPFKGDFSFGKTRSHRVPYLGWVTWVIWCFTKKLHETWCMSRCIVVMKMQIASCPSLHWNHPHSFCRGMFKLNRKLDADVLLYLLSHFECDGHTVHMFTEQCLLLPLTSTVKLSFSHIHIPVHSPWLPGYIDVVQTVFYILTMAGLFMEQIQENLGNHCYDGLYTTKQWTIFSRNILC